MRLVTKHTRFGPDDYLDESFPTEARLRQKEKQKADKEAGIKPKKRPQHIEHGDDDCGDDLSGLGGDIALLSSDYLHEQHDDDDQNHLFITITPSIIAPWDSLLQRRLPWPAPHHRQRRP